MAPVGAASRRRHIEAGRTRLAGWPGNEASLDVRVFDQGSRQCGGVSTDPGNVRLNLCPSGVRRDDGELPVHADVERASNAGTKTDPWMGAQARRYPATEFLAARNRASPPNRRKAPRASGGHRRTPRAFRCATAGRQTEMPAPPAEAGDSAADRLPRRIRHWAGRRGLLRNPARRRPKVCRAGPGARSSGGKAEGPNRHPAPLGPRLPWLSPARNAALVQADKQLDRLVRRQKSPLLRDELTAA